MVIGWLRESGDARLGGDLVSADDRRQVRERYRIEPADFTALLIGKDGPEKDRALAVPDLDGIFPLIDTMPKRDSAVPPRTLLPFIVERISASVIRCLLTAKEWCITLR